MKKILFLLLISVTVFAQNPTRNKYGFASNLTQSERTAIASPFTGQLVYQTDGDSGVWLYTGSVWEKQGGGNFIPLTGTTPTEPVTGVVQSESLWELVNLGTSLGYLGNDGGIGSLKLTNGAEKYVRVDNDQIEFNRNDIGSMLFQPEYDNYGFRVSIPGDEFVINKRGLIGNEDYTPNVQDLDFVQKKYVDDLFAGGGTPQGLEANRLVDNSMEGDVTNTGKYVSENESGKTEVAWFGVTAESYFGTGYYTSSSFGATAFDYNETFVGFQEGYFKHEKEGTTNQKGISIGLDNFINGDPSKTVFAAWPNPELEPGQVPTFAVSASVNGGAKVFATGDGNIDITVSGGGSGVQSVNPGANISVDNTDPENPVVGVVSNPSFGNTEINGNLIVSDITSLSDDLVMPNYLGTGNIVIQSNGTWQGVPIADGKIASASTWNAKQNQLNGTGLVRQTGTTTTYDNTTYAPDANVVHNTGNESIAGVKTFTSSPIVPDATTANQAVNKGQLDQAVKKVINNTAAYNLTGTPNETKMFSQLVSPADGKIWELIFKSYKTGTAGNATFKVYLNNSDAIGGTLIASFTQATTNIYQGMGRMFSMDSGNIAGFNATSGGVLFDLTGSSAAGMSVAYPTGTVYFVISCQLNNSATR